MHLVPGIAVVVTPEGSLLIIDELFVCVQLFKDALLHLFANPLRRASVVGGVEPLRVLFELLEKHKKA